MVSRIIKHLTPTGAPCKLDECCLFYHLGTLVEFSCAMAINCTWDSGSLGPLGLAIVPVPVVSESHHVNGFVNSAAHPCAFPTCPALASRISDLSARQMMLVQIAPSPSRLLLRRYEDDIKQEVIDAELGSRHPHRDVQHGAPFLAPLLKNAWLVLLKTRKEKARLVSDRANEEPRLALDEASQEADLPPRQGETGSAPRELERGEAYG
ncbi:hypothetical protein BC826DRAFT_1131283 [Russula brevipes]|nr:hypothetical protein BC826DRAFT_1131283 [Russula brevipes]